MRLHDLRRPGLLSVLCLFFLTSNCIFRVDLGHQRPTPSVHLLLVLHLSDRRHHHSFHGDGKSHDRILGQGWCAYYPGAQGVWWPPQFLSAGRTCCPSSLTYPLPYARCEILSQQT
ncbi:hypothetical protein EDB89DRAFT_819858 [Lactarius sanguifluus]|nr:hypothetical protein EDB89DRAFT_819858 [Lactarius sanguifluus]